MIQRVINFLLGDRNKKEINKLWPTVRKINLIEEDYQKNLKPEDIPRKTDEFKQRLATGKETLDDLLPEAFALVKYACRTCVGKKWTMRGNEMTWDMVPFDVQLLGGITLHHGKISEMKTGEGKTLVCVAPAYLNALKDTVFIVTVNEYLAKRDAEWMGQVYNTLGLTVGTTHHGQNEEEKRNNYACNIVYGTNNEFGFDYLRDNMATTMDNVVQKNLYYAIVDEVDSILIDEARTPLIISAAAAESTDKYMKYSRLVGQLRPDEDYLIDEKLKTAVLTEAGIARMEGFLGVENIYTDMGFSEVHHIEQALKARACYKLDVDYVIKDGEILIVDEFTGRLMQGRRYSEGLHQAIEAKENVEVKRESKTLATISFQNYFRLFKKLAGMTGTAATEAEEFLEIYGLDTMIIPTNKQMIRADRADAIYKNQLGKFQAVVKRIKELNEKGQPVLVGTISVEKSEVLSEMLKQAGVQHKVLNAKFHEKEAEIIKDAGQEKAVTIATNMAGRGTDIKLEEIVKNFGGLCILGTERHESRRIDNQLRGRSGRQGDPGESQFFVSMEDDLMRLFGSDRVKRMMDILKIPDDMPIENRMISSAIESAQKKVEGHNFDIRKHLVQYDDVINIHREIVYARRRKILESTNIRTDIMKLIEDFASILVRNYTNAREVHEWDYEKIYLEIKNLAPDAKTPLTLEMIQPIADQERLIEVVTEHLTNEYEYRESVLPDSNIMREIERSVYLRTIDTLWMEHIDDMASLRESVSLSGYGQKDPLTEYKNAAFETFNKLIGSAMTGTVTTLFKIPVAQIAHQQVMIKAQEQKNLITNEDQIEAALNQDISEDKSNSNSGLPKVGRNDACPCGSGKKYKKCHGA
ncbi:MAG: protein translocase subunit preprotein translocase subunit SecA [Candidatus Peregrinibacteria bacterium GW2011_GWC2_39_14]|nr:MAG: Protein translocase subunit SecA [Candidatus Peregrinibacteria bacterium GW2011_GWA2_38_36]KKR04557.1 MAG: protein translocase subunit preprotein translocase subunit SecA [Candidatus Peregrinibacteria bacterium GW2011_GWC2_39_14]